MERANCKRVAVSGLKSRLSEYLMIVRGGGTVIVTDRGRPVARIEPLTAAQDWGPVAEALAAQGLARLPLRPLPVNFFERL